MAHPESLDASGFDPDVLARHAQFVRRLARDSSATATRPTS
jgi:hypothetical protein